MDIPRWATVKIVLTLLTFLSVTALYNLGYTIDKYDKSPGIYYENKGVAVLYNGAWRTIVYVDFNKIDNETLMIKQYVHYVEICAKRLLLEIGQVALIFVAIPDFVWFN